jgi:hypothetical protein
MPHYDTLFRVGNCRAKGYCRPNRISAQICPEMGRFSVLRGMGPAIVDLSKLLSMSLSMKAILYAQLQPVKTMKQLVNDRCLYRLLILGMILMNWCS